MRLYDCEVSIKPKGSPEQNITLWLVDVEIPLEEFVKGGSYKMQVNFHIKPDPTKRPSMCLGIFGQETEA